MVGSWLYTWIIVARHHQWRARWRERRFRMPGFGSGAPRSIVDRTPRGPRVMRVAENSGMTNNPDRIFSHSVNLGSDGRDCQIFSLGPTAIWAIKGDDGFILPHKLPRASCCQDNRLLSCVRRLATISQGERQMPEVGHARRRTWSFFFASPFDSLAQIAPPGENSPGQLHYSKGDSRRDFTTALAQSLKRRVYNAHLIAAINPRFML